MINRILNLFGIMFLVVCMYYATIYTAIDGKENFTFNSLMTNTDYSDGYSDIGYLQVGIGDTKEYVVKKLGNPRLCETVNSLEICRYGWSDRDAYRCRWIEYDKNNIVTKKCSGVIPD